MKPIRRLFAVIIILALGALACNLPSNAPTQAPTNTQNSTPQPADLSAALTLAVQTIQAATQQAQTSIPANTAPPAATPSTPIVTVSSATNCRTGQIQVMRLCWSFSRARQRRLSANIHRPTIGSLRLQQAVHAGCGVRMPLCREMLTL